MSDALSLPAGRCRSAVRGLRASMFRSMNLFAAIPRVRAAIMATVIQTNW